MKDSLKFLNSIRAFEVAAKHSSFVKAANELNVSHSVVSQHVKKLECWLGVNLFNRYGNRVELSEYGKTYIRYVNRSFKILRDASDEIKNKTMIKQLIIFAEPTIASRWLRRRLKEFSEENPYIDVKLISAWNSPTFKDSKADVIIHFESRLSVFSEKSHRLFSIDGTPACSPDLLKRLTKGDKVINLQSAPLVHDNRNKIWENWYRKYLPTSENWKNGKIYADLSLAIESAADGDGFIIADDILCRKEIESGELICTSDESIHCAWYSSVFRVNSDEVLIFKEWLLSQKPSPTR